MNLVPKKNLWIIRTAQVVRMANAGSDWTQKSGGSCVDNPVTPGEKPSVVIRVDAQGESDPMKSMAYVTSQRVTVEEGVCKSDGSCAGTPDVTAEKPVDVKEASDPMKTMAYVTPQSVSAEEGVCKSDGSCAGSPVVTAEKPVGIKEGSDPMKTMTYVTPQPMNAEAEREHIRMTTAQAKALTKQDVVDKETGEFLTRYYGDQLKYFKNMAKVNNSAMKRIKKLRKDWLKFCEKHF